MSRGVVAPPAWSILVLGTAGCSGHAKSDSEEHPVPQDPAPIVACEPIVACGGDLIGRWNLVETCDSREQRSKEICSTSGAIVTEWTHSSLFGFYEFHADGSLTGESRRESLGTMTMPIDCPRVWCDETPSRSGLPSPPGSTWPGVRYEESCIRVEDSCVCELERSMDFGFFSEAYAVDGSTLSWIGASVTELQFCVEGDRLILQGTETGSVLVRD